jgi:hypothetical protein
LSQRQEREKTWGRRKAKESNLICVRERREGELEETLKGIESNFIGHFDYNYNFKNLGHILVGINNATLLYK